MELGRELPLTVPSKLIDQRPDVRMAEALLRSTNADVGTAIANRLPQFPSSGAIGGASEFTQIFGQGGAKVQLDIAKRQLSTGQVNELFLVQAESASLFMALGGGWWNRPDQLSSK